MYLNYRLACGVVVGSIICEEKRHLLKNRICLRIVGLKVVNDVGKRIIGQQRSNTYCHDGLKQDKAS